MDRKKPKPDDNPVHFDLTYQFGDSTEMTLRADCKAFGCLDALYATVGGKRVKTLPVALFGLFLALCGLTGCGRTLLPMVGADGRAYNASVPFGNDVETLPDGGYKIGPSPLLVGPIGQAGGRAVEKSFDTLAASLAPRIVDAVTTAATTQQP